MSDTYPRLGTAQSNLSNKKGGREAWMVTFADMITLLFTFVLIILKVSDIDQNRFDELREGLSQTLLKQDVSTAFKSVTEEIQTLKERFTQIQVQTSNKDIEITFANSDFYEVGSAEITEDGKVKIQELLDVLDKGPYKRYFIEVEGHTDDVPIKNRRFASNWELSTARATNIVKQIENSGIPRNRMRAVGYAESQPLPESLDEQGEIDSDKRGLNRRIVIKISRYRP